ncbi:hypothetical protein EW146_g98 [Bondarzewia mesenterica]|uniref:Shugoshin C-terminal domain-containing protein n=1 Tax=Bondarzewia mesenterica TaxID=1095465 RepID=A0A4S4M9N1_9AGAM|nr:hypothetical protein EW146_g98 [Bondarzewia mesenterica]
MSRRESRVSMTSRQNDALQEFENFKKKFLLANKHITKLNSTLSIRIEELNAQISALYVENLRLRASEIALATQLKKERERSQRVMADAEIATHALLKHFGSIRKNFSIPSGKPPSPSKQTQLPKAPARKPVLDPEASPHVNRLARAPNFPQILEEDETVSDADDLESESSPSPLTRRKKSHSSSSSSRLPLSSVPSTLSPPTITTIHVNLEQQLLQAGKKKISRRQSGLLTVNTTPGAGSSRYSSSSRSEASSPRPPSPAFGSPARREAGIAEEEEEIAAISGHIEITPEEVEEELERAARRERKRKTKSREVESLETERTRDKEKRKIREEEESGGSHITEGSKWRLQDVTNSPGSRTSLPPLDTHVSGKSSVDQSPDTDVPTSAFTNASASTRPLLSTPATTPAPSHLPTPRSSSPVAHAEGDAPAAGSRERRVRKSINYAEPKLNTKMRKPDPPSSTTSKRSSMPSQHHIDSYLRPSLDPPSDTAEPSIKRRKSRPRLPPEEEEESEGAQADAEFPSGLALSISLFFMKRSCSPSLPPAPTAAHNTSLSGKLSSSHIAELSGIWAADQRVPTLSSRRTWALARHLKPTLVNKWFTSKKSAAKRAGKLVSDDTYDLPVDSRIVSSACHDGERPRRRKKELFVDSPDVAPRSLTPWDLRTMAHKGADSRVLLLDDIKVEASDDTPSSPDILTPSPPTPHRAYIHPYPTKMSNESPSFFPDAQSLFSDFNNYSYDSESMYAGNYVDEEHVGLSQSAVMLPDMLPLTPGPPLSPYLSQSRSMTEDFSGWYPTRYYVDGNMSYLMDVGQYPLPAEAPVLSPNQLVPTTPQMRETGKPFVETIPAYQQSFTDANGSAYANVQDDDITSQFSGISHVDNRPEFRSTPSDNDRDAVLGILDYIHDTPTGVLVARLRAEGRCASSEPVLMQECTEAVTKGNELDMALLEEEWLRQDKSLDAFDTAEQDAGVNNRRRLSFSGPLWVGDIRVL